MSGALAVKIDEIRDGYEGADLEPRDWNEWTPLKNRVFARTLVVNTSFGQIELIESDKNDPTRLMLFVSKKGESDRWAEINDMSARELDALINGLIAARDHAIVNWMIEPRV